MRAMVIRNYGGPEVMHEEDFALPVPRAGEVLVHLYATSVNPFDLYRRSGAVKEQAPVAFPGMVGVDVAGFIQAVGEGVEGFQVGDDVLCMADATYAEFCTVAASSLVRIPAGMDVFDAAAIPLVLTTGSALARSAGATQGKTVLVTGAIGNVGRSAVYALKQAGVTVVAGVLGSQVQAAKSIGADRVIATDDPAAIDALESLDAVADTVDGVLAERLIAKVKPGGVFASVLGVPKNAQEYPDVSCISFSVTPDAEILASMVEAVQSGALTIPIGRKYQLAEAATAHQDVAQGAIHGKALLIVDADGTAHAEAVRAVSALLAEYNAALNGSDTDRIVSLYTTDGIFMAPFSPSNIGPAAIRAAYDNVFRTRKFDVVFRVMEVVALSQEYAYARTNSTGHTTNPATGEQSSEGNQELFLFRRVGASWRIARYSFSPTGSSAA